MRERFFGALLSKLDRFLTVAALFQHAANSSVPGSFRIEYEYRCAEYEYDKFNRNLGAQVMQAGVVGDAPEGRTLRRLLEESGIDATAVLAARGICSDAAELHQCSHHVPRDEGREGQAVDARGVHPAATGPSTFSSEIGCQSATAAWLIKRSVMTTLSQRRTDLWPVALRPPNDQPGFRHNHQRRGL